MADVQIKLRPEVKKKWLKALRSGDYKQTTGKLAVLNEQTGKPEAFCCLGVLCDIHRRSRRQKGDKWVDDTYHDQESVLPPKVINWAFTSSTIAGLEANGKDAETILDDVMIGGDRLSVHNDDNGCTFNEIANIIENNL